MTQCVMSVLECLKDQQNNGGVMAASDWIYLQVVEKYICKRIMKMHTNKKLYLIIFPLAIIILFSPSMAAYGISSTPQYFTRDSSPYGTPYSDWIKKWWQWNVSVPKAEHPQTNPKVVCATKVSGQVSFLVQNLQGTSHYSCTVILHNHFTTFL